MRASQPLDSDDDDFFSFDASDLAPEPVGLDTGERPVPPRLGLLAGLSTEEFDAVARAAQLKHHEPGTELVSQGDSADRFFILVDGRVRVVRDGTTIAELGPGSFFGEGVLHRGGRRTATV